MKLHGSRQILTFRSTQSINHFYLSRLPQDFKDHTYKPNAVGKPIHIPMCPNDAA